MSARVRAGSQPPARGGDGRRYRWSESPIPRVATRRVRSVQAVVADPAPLWFWDFSDADNSAGGPQMDGPSAPYTEYVLADDWTLTGADPDDILDYDRTAGDWTYSGTGATLGAGSTGWLYTGSVSDAYDNYAAWYWTYGPSDEGLIAKITTDGLESTGTSVDLVTFADGPQGTSSWQPTLAGYLATATLISTISSVSGDLVFITDGVTIATVTAPAEPTTIRIYRTALGGTTITVNGVTAVTEGDPWADPIAFALTGATGGTSFDYLGLHGFQMGNA